MALDSSYSFITHFSQFLCGNLRILPNLLFYPFIKIVVLSIALSITLSITLSNTLNNTLSNILSNILSATNG